MISMHDSLLYWIEDTQVPNGRNIIIRKKTRNLWGVTLKDENGLSTYGIHADLELAILTALNNMRGVQALHKQYSKGAQWTS